MRALWVKAPLVLRHYPPILATVAVTSLFVALAAASVPLVRAGVESESLRGQLRSLSPFAAGFEVRVLGPPVGGDATRRHAAVELGSELGYVGAPTTASLLPAQLDGSASPGLDVVAVARTGAVAHVRRLTAGDPNGVWIADTTARVARLHRGDLLRLTEQMFLRRPRVVRMRIAGVYRSLDSDPDRPYWANWVQDIRSESADAPPPPAFVLMPESTFAHTAHVLAPVVENRFEFPIDADRITADAARRLDRRFTSLASEITRRDSSSGRALGCGVDRGRTSSSLAAALSVASGQVAAVSPTVSLLATCGIVIGLGLGVAAGFFLVRRRSDEAHALFARGERPSTFAARTGLEALVPASLGLAAGLGAAILTVRALAPVGTLDGATVNAAAVRAAAACALAVIAVATGAALAFPRPSGRTGRRGRVLKRVPWEVVPATAVATLLVVVLTGGGLATDSSGAHHPRLAIFLLPIVAAAGGAGLAVRALRVALLRVRTRAAVPIFLALRRVSAARGLLVAVVVAVAAGFGTFAYAATLSASLERSSVEKAYVANGSDVQGLVDPAKRVYGRFPFPLAVAEIDQRDASTPSGQSVDLIAGDPAALARTIRWGKTWSDDPRPLLRRLTRPGDPAVAALATPGAPSVDAIVDQGARIPIRIVGRAPFPGTTAGRPAYVVSRAALRQAARRDGILEPGPGAGGVVWAKGRPELIEPVLRASSLAPVYLTTLGDFRRDPSVAAADRSYRFVKLIGGSATVLALLALLLYLQARQRSQLIASALVRRMGLGNIADGAALASEAVLITGVAALAGGAAATAAARAVGPHVDALPQYAPPPAFVVPWSLLGLGATILAAATAALAGGLVAIARRGDVAEALRVA
jgi:hypothetical protein